MAPQTQKYDIIKYCYKKENNMEPIVNKKAHFKFQIEDKFEGGIVLQGWELKPLLKRKANLDMSHLIIKNGEVFLINMNITPEKTADLFNKPDATRSRKILLHKKEIMQLIGKVEQKGYTLTPLKIYIKKNKFKLEFALAKGKKDHDKRQDIKEKDWQREQATIMKNKIKGLK